MQHARLTRYFTGWTPVRTCVRGASSRTVFGWVSFSSSSPVLLSIIPLAEGSAYDSSLSHIWLSGAPDSSDHQSSLSPLECEFSDLRLQIVHLQQCQSRNAISFGNIFSPQRRLSVLWLSSVSPGISVFPSKWAWETEIREVLAYVWGCCWENPIETKCVRPIQHVVVCWFWFTFQWISGPIFPLLCIPVMFRDN